MQGQQFGGILPNQQQAPSDTLAQINQQMYQRQQAAAAEARQQRAANNKMVFDAYSAVDSADVLNGTVYDKVVHKSLTDLKEQVASLIASNPDISSAEVMYMVAKGVGAVSQYSSKVKQVRLQSEAAVKELAKNPSINTKRLLDGALHDAFFEQDANGNFVMKDPNTVDDTKDYVSQFLEEKPELVVKGNGALTSLLKTADKKEYSNERTVDQGGVRKVMGYKGEYFPQYNVLLGANGKELTGNGVATGVGVRSQKIKVGNEIVDVADDNAYQYFTADPGAKAFLSAQAKQQYPGADPEIAKRRVLYEYLHSNNQGYINNTKDVIDNSQQQGHIWTEAARAFKESAKALTAAGGDFGTEYYEKKVKPRSGETELDDPIVANSLEKNSRMPNKVKTIGDGKYRAVFYKMDRNGNYLDKNGNIAASPDAYVESDLSYNVDPVQLKTMISAKYRQKLGVAPGPSVETKPAPTSPAPKTQTKNSTPAWKQRAKKV